MNLNLKEDAEKGICYMGFYYDVIDADGNVIATGVPGYSGDKTKVLFQTTLLIDNQDIVDGKVKFRYNPDPFNT